MAGTTTVTKVKVRRGTELQRRTVVFDSGELAYVIDADSRRLFVGDGITYGGISVGMRFYSGNRAASPITFARAQLGDIVYDTQDKALYTLSGIDAFGFPDYSNPAAYQNISTQVDNSTLEYNGLRQISIKVDGVSAQHIHSSAFDLEGGFLREVPNGVFKISIDNSSIRLNGSNQLSVDPRYIQWNLLPTTYPGPGTNKMWIDTVNGNVVKIAL
jgi:hypothetical protein